MTTCRFHAHPDKLFLTLRNELGQLQDAEYVVWTVTSAYDGKRVSGINMKAVRRDVGQYYASWYADDPAGAYEIVWEYKRGIGFPVEKIAERFFVSNSDKPVCGCREPVCGCRHGSLFTPP